MKSLIVSVLMVLIAYAVGISVSTDKAYQRGFIEGGNQFVAEYGVPINLQDEDLEGICWEKLYQKYGVEAKH